MQHTDIKEILCFMILFFFFCISDPSRIVNLPIEYNVSVHQSVSLHCQAEGNPEPSFTWTPCKDACDKRTLIIPEVLNDTVYTCTVANNLGSDSASTGVGKLALNSQTFSIQTRK